MKIAAYQAPLLNGGSMDALPLIRRRVEQCEAEGVAFLCCPEAILGGLADYSDDPTRFAVAADQIASVLTSLATDTVTTIVGFTELGDNGTLFNSAAVWHRGTVAGMYRKRHPAIRRSVYTAGTDTPVFRVDGLTFGVLLCNDSNFSDAASRMAEQGRPCCSFQRTTACPIQGLGKTPQLEPDKRTWLGLPRTTHGSSGPTLPAGRVSSRPQELRRSCGPMVPWCWARAGSPRIFSSPISDRWSKGSKTAMDDDGRGHCSLRSSECQRQRKGERRSQ